ncbi:hypothetical protein EDB84DRAFT_1459659, partial [Lactarius hengduanensis]
TGLWPILADVHLAKVLTLLFFLKILATRLFILLWERAPCLCAALLALRCASEISRSLRRRSFLVSSRSSTSSGSSERGWDETPPTGAIGK